MTDSRKEFEEWCCTIFHPYRPQVQDYIEATTILTRGAGLDIANMPAAVEAPSAC